MADPIPVVPIVTNLSNQIWPKVPMYMWDIQKAKFTTNPPTMDPVWVRFWNNLYNRVGGASGDIIYNNTTIGTLIEDEGGAGPQQIQDMFDQIGIASEMSIANTQQIESLIAAIDEATTSGQDCSQQIADLASIVFNLEVTVTGIQQFVIDYVNGALLTIPQVDTTQLAVDIVTKIGTKTIVKQVDFGDVSTIPTLLIPVDKWVMNVRVVVDTPFNGIAPQLSVGDAGDNNRLMPTGDNELSEPGTFTSTPSWKYAVETQINIYYSASGSTAGQAFVFITFQP